MSANLDMSNGRANIAFTGSRKSIWHRMGQELAPGQSMDVWAEQAGLNWHAVKVPAYADLSPLPTVGENYLRSNGMCPVEDRYFNARSDNGHILGGACLSSRHENVQPRELLDFFDRYISVDDRFAMSVAGSLGKGETVWATASFNGGIEIAGDMHQAYLLASTTFDGSGATTIQGTITRVVCNNTLNVAHADNRAVVKVRHSTKFEPARAAKQLAEMAKSFEVYKLMGDALAQAELSREQVADFFKDMLDIPRDAKADQVSTRKQNQYRDLAISYQRSVNEGAPESSGWAMLQAVTRYVDHSRSTRGGDDESQSRFESANFGSGDTLKGKAMGLLMPRIKDRVLIPA